MGAPRPGGSGKPRPARVAGLAAIAAGAVPLVWPALLNGYPLVFSDTGGFLHQTLGPLMLWDKPWVYGPLLHLFHWRATLWLPLAAQALLVSHLLWLAQRAMRGGASPAMHLGVCAFAALATPAPFTVALLMPDVFAPATVLAMALLAFARPGLSMAETGWLMLLATLGIASHLAHLPLALALAVLSCAAGWRAALRCMAPLLAAVALLLAGNAAGHGRMVLSPHGATFLLARLQADGPAAEVIRAHCPRSGWYLCAFADRLPMGSDEFLWHPESPVNRDAEGRARVLGGALLSAEAGEILALTLREHPLAVAGAMLRNTLRQLVTFGIGDTLRADVLATALRPRIAEGFPPRELAAFDAAMQARGVLGEAVAPLRALHAAVVIAALPLCALALLRARRAGDARRLGLLAVVLAALLANAAATGALSGVFPRYQARIVWLLPVATLLALAPRFGAGLNIAGRAAGRSGA